MLNKIICYFVGHNWSDKSKKALFSNVHFVDAICFRCNKTKTLTLVEYEHSVYKRVNKVLDKMGL